MVRELELFRQKMPHALMDGHISVDAMRNDANISGTLSVQQLLLPPSLKSDRRFCAQ